MNRMFKIFSIAALLTTGAFAVTTPWVPPVGSNICTTAGAFTVKAIQYTPSTTSIGNIQVFLKEYSGITHFEYDYDGTSATAVQQANAMLSLLETAKATGTKISLLLDNSANCGTPILGNGNYYHFILVQMDTYP